MKSPGIIVRLREYSITNGKNQSIYAFSNPSLIISRSLSHLQTVNYEIDTRILHRPLDLVEVTVVVVAEGQPYLNCLSHENAVSAWHAVFY